MDSANRDAAKCNRASCMPSPSEIPLDPPLTKGEANAVSRGIPLSLSDGLPVMSPTPMGQHFSAVAALLLPACTAQVLSPCALISTGLVMAGGSVVWYRLLSPQQITLLLPALKLKKNH